MPAEAAAPGRSRDDALRATRRRRLVQELIVRGAVSLAVLSVNELFQLSTGAAANSIVRVSALLGLGLNLPYYLFGRTARWPRLQTYTRMFIDIALITLGLYSAGGLAGAPYVGVYTIVPLYVGLVFSSWACLVATGVATAAYGALAGLQSVGWLPTPTPPAPSAWGVAAFNLLVLNIVGGLTALLAEAYRDSRLRLAALNRELERASDESLRLTAEIQRAAHLRMLGEVVAGVTHEIGNVLTVAAGHITLARGRVKTLVPELLTHLDPIEESCRTAMRIVRNALETSRHGAVARVAVSIPDLAQHLLELKGYDLRRDGIVVRLHFPRDFPAVAAAPFQLQQVLLNLVTNAQDALRGVSGARAIDIVGVSAAGRVIVEVQDTGPGIPPEALPRVLEPFYTTKANGTGLGLAISAGILRDLGGELTVANRPGGGAIVRLTLPALR